MNNIRLFMLTVVEKAVTWNTNYSMIYIDNPVGTGFSFTDQDAGYATNEADVGRDLYRYIFYCVQRGLHTFAFEYFTYFQKSQYKLLIPPENVLLLS